MALSGLDSDQTAGPALHVIDPVWTEQIRAVYGDVRGPLWRALVAFSSSAEVADESMSEGFTQLLRRGSDVRDPAAWVWRASMRIAAGDLQRRREAAARQAGEPPEAALANLAGNVDRLPGEALDLLRALSFLSDQQRRCVALVDIAGHTAPSAAAVLGTSPATVRVQLMRARRRLRVQLGEQGEIVERAGNEHARASTTTGKEAQP